MTRVQQRAHEWERIKEAYGYCCAYCGLKPHKLYREHMYPKCRGGGEELENIFPACNSCNIRKGRRTPLEWFLVRDEKLPPQVQDEWGRWRNVDDVPLPLACRGVNLHEKYTWLVERAKGGAA